MAKIDRDDGRAAQCGLGCADDERRDHHERDSTMRSAFQHQRRMPRLISRGSMAFEGFRQRFSGRGSRDQTVHPSRLHRVFERSATIDRPRQHGLVTKLVARATLSGEHYVQ